MPKAQKRRRAPARGSTSQSRIANAKQGTSNGASTRSATEPASVDRRFISPRVSGPQSLIFPGMVALGCWLMAYTLMFLTTDPNRYIFGGLAALIALFWSFSFGVRVRKLLLQQRSRA